MHRNSTDKSTLKPSHKIKILLFTWLVYITLGTMLTDPASAVPASDSAPPPQGGSTSQDHSLFVPILARNIPLNQVLLGVSPTGYVGDHSVVEAELLAFDAWAGKPVSIVGFFMDIQEENPSWDINHQFENLRMNGYTGFLNLMTNHSIASVANGNYDQNIRSIAAAYASWSSKGPNRMSFIAPFPEMNGDWYSYGEDPVNFKIAFQRIRDIFTQMGVAPDAVRWVFAPNGWSKMPFEDFYPGDDLVDVFAFSSYNYGYCPAIAPWERWVLPDEVFGPYIRRLVQLNPSIPIFVAQTASTARTANGFDETYKNQWLVDAYNYLASSPNVKSILYFNIQMECDWPIFTPGGVRFDGYKNAVTNPAFIYLSPDELAQDNLIP